MEELETILWTTINNKAVMNRVKTVLKTDKKYGLKNVEETEKAKFRMILAMISLFEIIWIHGQ